MFLWLFSLEPSIPATQIHRARIAGLCWLSLRIQRPQGRHWPIATYQFMVEAEDLCGLVSLDSFDTSSSHQGALSCSSSCNASDWPQSVTRCLVGTKDIPVVSSSFMVFFGDVPTGHFTPNTVCPTNRFLLWEFAPRRPKRSTLPPRRGRNQHVHVTQTLHGTAIYAYIWGGAREVSVSIYGIHGVSM